MAFYGTFYFLNRSLTAMSPLVCVNANNSTAETAAPQLPGSLNRQLPFIPLTIASENSILR
jgi:hypothetical protein